MIKFTKMHGLGNDYVYIYCNNCKTQKKNISSLARFVSNRHFGIGSDGLILISDSQIADFKMRIFNSDGSEAKMCGNGIRCVGKFVYDKHLTTKENITIETLSGVKNLQLNVENEKVKTVKVDMGKPILEAEKIPVISDMNIAQGLKLTAIDKDFYVDCISMGNPHAVTKVENLENFEIEKYGPVLENDKHFPDRANIEFIEVIDRKNVKMRVWERGSGETLACGTGACSVAVSCILNRLTENKINVELLGGTLKIEWNENNKHIYMTGPAETVYEGEFEYDNN